MMIGYHFVHIKDFNTHFPRIADFWELQLLGTCSHPESLPFDLIGVHRPMGIKKAQVGRWVQIFKETLNEFHNQYMTNEDQNSAKTKIAYLDLWLTKILHFQERFLGHPGLFPRVSQS